MEIPSKVLRKLEPIRLPLASTVLAKSCASFAKSAPMQKSGLGLIKAFHGSQS
jgi:hypothetical protein